MIYPGKFKWWALLFALALLPAPASHAAARLLRATPMTVARGETNSLFIVLDAAGDENAAGFSLCYDTNLLTYIRAVRGADAPSATLNLNTNQVFRGRVGIAFGLSSGAVFGPGSHSVVEVSFRAAPGITSVTTDVAFCDLPIGREVVDADAFAVEADYADAPVAIVGNCNYSLSASTIAFGASGGSNSVAVTVAGGCPWSVLNTNEWITVTSGASGTGTGMVRYAVSPNFAATARTGLLEIAGQTFSVNQAGSSCTYALSPISRAHGSGPATNTVGMIANNGCAWVVSNANSWITIRSGGSGSGNGTVTYSVEANPNPMARTGLLQVAEQTFSVSQAAVVCSYKLSPTNRNHGSSAATNSIGVTTSSGCSWTVVNSNAWITITSGTQGQGTDNVDYEILANTSSTGRTGWVNVADQVFSISQGGVPCTYTIAPTSSSYGTGSATGLVAVTALAGCTWTVINTNSWITIQSGASGTGNGIVRYTVSSNTISTARSGVVKIAGVSHTVTQAGVFTCTYRLSDTNRTHGFGAASNSVSLTASNACNWIVINTNTWITITSATNGAGSDSVNYTILANTNRTPRTGVVRIAGQSLTLTQQAAPCEFSISASTRTHGFGAATNSVILTTASGCAWTARSTSSWVVITPITSGTASATVGYRVVANPNPVQRTSVVMIADQLLTLIQRAAPCSFEILPENQLRGPGIETGLVSVATSAACPWSAENTNAWITILSATNGTGNGIVRYRVAANPTHASRIGLLNIAGGVFTVTQAGMPCAYTITPTNRSHGYGAEVGEVSVTTSAGCTWNVSDTNSWISITSASSGTDSGVVTYAVAANPTLSPRTAVFTIAGRTFTVNQAAGPCTYKLSPVTRTHGSGTATNTVSLTTSNQCAWTLVNPHDWITIGSATNRTGSAVLTYGLAANPSSIDRTGRVMIAGQTFVLIQEGASCTYSISPSSRMHGPGAASNSVSLTTLAGCAWSAVSANDWIIITSSSTGTGSAAINYHLAANPTFSERTGSVQVADKVLTVIQHAASCAFSISPGMRMHGSGTATNTVSLSTSNECAWTVVNTNDWLNFASTSGTGSAVLAYTLAANPTLLARTGTVMIADETFTLVQSGISCAYSISPDNRTHGSGMASNSIGLTTTAGCVWNVVNNNEWITITSAGSGNSNATITYMVAANPSSLDRTGLVVVAEETFILVQRGAACEYSISPATRTHGSGAATNSIGLTTPAGCAWSVVNGNDWIAITSASNGAGSTTVNYTAAANPSSLDRTGLVVIADQTFALVQRGVPCEISISPATRTHGAGAATNSVSLTTAAGCAWSVINSNDWITITSAGSGTGSNTVFYTLAPNSGMLDRTGLVFIADKTFTLVQRGMPCEFSISPATRAHGAGAATNSVNLTTSAGCAWSVVNSQDWITITSEQNGTGSATVNYVVAANPSSLERTGLVAIAGQAFTLIQHGLPCEFSISPATRTHGSGSATNSVSLAGPAGCAWSVINSNDWITITSQSTGTGSATVNYLVAPNPSSLDRTGWVAIAEQTFALVQRGAACEFSISPATRTHGAGAATNSVSLTTAAGCAWSVINSNDWITITSAGSGTGSNAVFYTLAPNSGMLDRTGLVFIADKTFTLVQRGVPCEFSISPATRAHGAGAATNSVNLTTSAGCAWSVVNSQDWITITSEQNGTGSATVNYVVAANPSSLERTGLVAIAGQTFVLVQRGAPCEFSISPAMRMHGQAAATNSVNLTTIAGCAWRVVNTNDWIAINSDSSGTGSASINYSVAANPSPLERTGLVSIADQTFTLIQHGLSCEFSISPTNRTHGTGSATNSVSLTGPAGCAWSVVNSNDWITITSETNGTGSAVLNYVVTANPASTERSGTVLIAGEIFTLVQRGAGCTLALSPASRMHGFAPATNAITLNTAGDCAWTIVNTNDWITITSALSGTGATSIAYVLAANPITLERTGLVTIGNQILTLTQRAAPCSFDLTPPNRLHSSDGGTGSVAVATSSNCSWDVVNTNAWITMSGPTNGLGNGSVAYAVAANPSPLPRTGVVTIGGEPFRVSQTGVPCMFALSASSRLHEAGTETGSVGVITVSGCSWTVSNANDWIDILAGANGAGSGTVTYRIHANPSIEPRFGLLTIAGEMFSVSQPGAACAYKLSPTNRVHGYGMATGTVSVTAIIGCSWSVVNTNDWLTITSGPGGTGNGSVTYSVAANPAMLGRMGVVKIADQAFMISQLGTPCTVAISPATRQHGYGATTGTVSLTTLTGCPWQIVNTNDWLAVTSSLSGTGNASVTYTVAANASTSERTGVILIADQPLTVSQHGIPCQFFIAPESGAHGAGAETGTVSLTTGSGCAWSVINTNDWLTITSSLAGTGNATVTYRVAANGTIVARTGVVMIAGQGFTVAQQGAPCTIAISTGARAHGPEATTGTVSLTTLAGCAWAIVNTNDWIRITSSLNGAGSADLTYAVDANTTTVSRSGVIAIGGQLLTVSQQAAPSEAIKPLVTITFPVVNARTTNSLITGTARDNRGIAQVRIQLGNGPVLTAVGTNAWSINLAGMLAPGTNVIRVQSVDSSGNESLMITRRFVFVPTSPLTVQTNGTGTVTPNLNGRRLEVGRSYTVLATPGVGQVFSNWTGGVPAGNSRLTFVMQSNLMIRANFVPNPFRSVKGTYTGLFHPGQAEHARSGFLNLALTERGSFTATMLTGGRRLVFSGAFNLLGTTTNTVLRAGTNALIVELTLDLTPGGTQITGVVRDGILEATLRAARATFHPVTNPATNFAGKYTIILPATMDSAILPSGDGIGTVIVDRGGNVIFAGTLADGTPVAQRALLSPNGEWPLYAPLYAGKGSLLSGVTFTTLAHDDLMGQFRWTKPVLPLAKYYPAGFDVPWTPLLGSRYTAPGTNRIINITQGQVEFMGGNLTAPFTNQVTLSAGNKITNLNSNRLTLLFALPTGLLNGTAVIPGTTKTVLLKGAVHQKRELASGFFLGTNQSGRVEFAR